ncbi:MAG: ATP-binding protein [Paludibacteraceae bacterium]|nr:ATP-binding protein [Paludibacteraceae bacterium]
MNSAFIEKELAWYTRVLVTRLKLYFNQEADCSDIYSLLPPSADGEQGAYARFIEKHRLEFNDRIFLMTAFVPFIKPQQFDCFNVKNSDTGLRFVEFGCEEKGNVVLPTLETVLFILAGGDTTKKMELASYFKTHGLFNRKAFYRVDSEASGTFSSMVISPSEELVDTLILNKPFCPQFSSHFPARRVSTNRSWDELVLSEQTLRQLNDIKLWVKYGEKVRSDWHLATKIKPGYRALFFGPPGSGKTFTATLLGKETGKEVYCVDLSMVVSKYIGETEKNLAKVFEFAEDKDWILLFDEADSLFGKRTSVKDAHDRYANQEVAYLLQRIEAYNGLVILSTNLRDNVDEAFSRRFQSIIHFPMPDAGQREQLWKEIFSPMCSFEDESILKTVAEKYELSGGSILNVVEYCSILSMSRNSSTILNDDLKEGIKRELAKEGKMM